MWVIVGAEQVIGSDGAGSRRFGGEGGAGGQALLLQGSM